MVGPSDVATGVQGSASTTTYDGIRADALDLVGRYPQGRSALLPLLHLVQSVDGTVTTAGIRFCADLLDLSTAEVAGVASFYTMFKRHRVGTYHVGVCTNTLCAVVGGDAIWSALSEHLGIGTDEVTADGAVSLERIECQAACTHAPVMTANWEFLDDMDVPSAIEIVDRLRAGEPVRSTRGPVVPTFTETERLLAGFEDGLVDSGVRADGRMLAGVTYAAEHGMAAPALPAGGPFSGPRRPTDDPAEPEASA